MKEFLSLSVIENKHLSLDMEGFFGIVGVILLTIVLSFLVKRLRKRIEQKSKKWIYLTRNSSKIAIFLIVITGLISIFEIMGISLANYMSFGLVKTERILITPSRILFIVILLLITWGISLSLKSIFTNYLENNQTTLNYASMNIFKLVKYILWIIAIGISMQSIGLNLTFV